MYRIWIDRERKPGKYIALEKDGSLLPPVAQIDILGPSRVIFDPETALWPQGWVETDSEIKVYMGDDDV